MTKINKTSNNVSSASKFYNTIILLIIGACLIIVLSWFFGGFGYWNIPGMIVLFSGFALLIYVLTIPALKNTNPYYKGGLFILLIGAALFLSFIPHILLGTYQIISLVIIVLGILVTVYGLYKALKT
ncbi:MAG: hypothetical protein ACTSQY_11505 [Candidatus Odinarchaeia archaeon]